MADLQLAHTNFGSQIEFVCMEAWLDSVLHHLGGSVSQPILKTGLEYEHYFMENPYDKTTWTPEQVSETANLKAAAQAAVDVLNVMQGVHYQYP